MYLLSQVSTHSISQHAFMNNLRFLLLKKYSENTDPEMKKQGKLLTFRIFKSHFHVTSKTQIFNTNIAKY